jgi:hypothetical protein
LLFRKLELEATLQSSTQSSHLAAIRYTTTGSPSSLLHDSESPKSPFSQFAFFYNQFNGLLNSFREKLTNNNGNVSVTAVVCATLGAFSLSVVVSLGSSAYVSIRFNSQIKQESRANKYALDRVDLNNKSCIESLIANVRDSAIKSEPKCSIENEIV